MKTANKWGDPVLGLVSIQKANIKSRAKRVLKKYAKMSNERLLKIRESR